MADEKEQKLMALKALGWDLFVQRQRVQLQLEQVDREIAATQQAIDNERHRAEGSAEPGG